MAAAGLIVAVVVRYQRRQWDVLSIVRRRGADFMSYQIAEMQQQEKEPEKYGRQETGAGDELCVKAIPSCEGGSEIYTTCNQIARYQNKEYLQTNKCNGFTYLLHSDYDTKC